MTEDTPEAVVFEGIVSLLESGASRLADEALRLRSENTRLRTAIEHILEELEESSEAYRIGYHALARPLE